MELTQLAHDLANDYFKCHMKNSCSFTYNVSNDSFNCFLYNSKDDQVDLLYEMNLFDKLHDDFKLGKEGWSNFCVSNYKDKEWEMYDNVSVFSSVQIEEKKWKLIC